MELSTAQAARFLNLSEYAMKRKVELGEFTARITSGKGPGGRIMLIEVPNATPEAIAALGPIKSQHRPTYVERAAPAKVPAGYVSLKQAAELTGQAPVTLAAKCKRGAFPSARKLQTGNVPQWYIARADLGLPAASPAAIAVTPPNAMPAQFDDLLNMVGPVLKDVLAGVFAAGEASGIEKAKQSLANLANGSAD